MNTSVLDKNLVQAGQYGSVITASAGQSLPTKIEVMRAGTWPADSNKGALWITPDDLNEFVSNFKAGIGIPGGADFGQLPIDFNHDDDDEAAGWIVDLSVDNNVLYADVSWSTAGEAALKGGMYKCFSPSFWPACLGEWYDPENYAETATNVLVGGALTNIPFFKDLKAIMASNAGNSKDSKVNSNAPKENTVPTLDEVRIKDVASLTADDKKVLADNKTSLSAEELKKFSLEDTAVVTASAVTGLNDEDARVLASIKTGEMKVVNASEYDGMKSQVEASSKQLKEMHEASVRASVVEHVKRGAIKADQVDVWTSKIVADASMADLLKDIKGDKIVASEIGNDGAKDVDATKEFEAKVDASMKLDPSLTYAQAVTKVANEDVALANNHESQVVNQ